MFEKIENTFNQIFQFNRDERAMFYKVVITQLEVGMPVKSVFEILHRDIDISPGITKAAAAGYQAICEGRSGTEGLRDCNLFPPEEVYLLAAAEENDVLLDTLRHLQTRSTASATFFQAAILSNAYYFGIMSALIFMALKVEDFAASFGGWVNLENNAAYVLSITMNDYAAVATIGSGIFIFLVWLISNHWYNPLRRCVLFFSVDAQLQLGIKFCSLSSAFYGTGATHSNVLHAATDIFSGSGYMRGALADLKTRYELQGDAYNDALGDTVLLPNIAKVLGAMTPGEDRSTFAAAHDALENLQISLVNKRHAKAKVMVLCLLFGVISYLLLTMLIGLYSMYDF